MTLSFKQLNEGASETIMQIIFLIVAKSGQRHSLIRLKFISYMQI